MYTLFVFFFFLAFFFGSFLCSAQKCASLLLLVFLHLYNY